MTGLDVGDGLHISAFNLPEGVEPTITDRDFTVATIAAPAALKSDDEETESEDVAPDEAEEASEDSAE